MDVDSMLLLFLVAQFKIGIYAFWKISSRLHKLERANFAIKSAMATLHKKEFNTLKESLNRINISMENRPVAMDIVCDEAQRLEEDVWPKEAG